MLKERIKDIEIWYDKEHILEFNHARKIIENNYEMFNKYFLPENKIISLIETGKTGIVCVPKDFDNYFSNLVKELYNHIGQYREIKDERFFQLFYLEYLNRINPVDDDRVIIPRLDMYSNEDFEETLAYNYYLKKGTMDDFIEYLKNKDNNKEIFEWLRDNYRYDAYNYLLKNFIECQDIIGSKFREQASKTVFLLANDSYENIMKKARGINVFDTNKLPDLSKEELDKMFTDFLNKIGAPKSWKEKYEEVKKNNLIFIPRGDFNSSYCTITKDNEIAIVLSDIGKLDTFITLAHEFAHYISLSNMKDGKNYALNEFPSIFFEKIAIDYLSSLGYSNEVIETVINFRIDTNQIQLINYITIFRDLDIYTEKGSITEEDIIVFKKNSYEIMKMVEEEIRTKGEYQGVKLTEEEMKEVFKKNYTLEELAHLDTDDNTLNLLLNGKYIFIAYKYFLGTVFADETRYKMMNDKTILNKMFDITDNLHSLSTDEVDKRIGIYDIFKDHEAKINFKEFNEE